MRPMQGRLTLHLSIPKLLLLALVRDYGAHGVLNGFHGTDAQAIELIAADDREFFTLEACDHQAADGSCLGHGGDG